MSRHAMMRAAIRDVVRDRRQDKRRGDPTGRQVNIESVCDPGGRAGDRYPDAFRRRFGVVVAAVLRRIDSVPRFGRCGTS